MLADLIRQEVETDLKALSEVRLEPIGSRFFGNASETSDHDFVTDEEVGPLLQQHGFKVVSVYDFGYQTIHYRRGNIDIVILPSHYLKRYLEVRDLLKQIPWFPTLPKQKRNQLWRVLL